MLAAATPAAARNLSFSTPTPERHIFTRTADRIAAALTSDGMPTTVFSSSKLGNNQTVVSMVQSAAVELSVIPVGDLAQREPAFYAWFMPYQFATLADAAAVSKTKPARDMMALLANQGIIGLDYVFPGQRHVLSKEPVKSPDDVKGLKIRAFPSDPFRAWWKELGAAPTALPLTDIMPSLVTGMIDAVDTDVDIVNGLSMYTQAPYLTLTNHMAFPGAVIASRRWWDGLNAKDRATVTAAVDEAVGWAVETQIAEEKAILEELTAKGAHVSQIDTTPFKAHGAAVVAQFINRSPLIAPFLEAAANPGSAR